MKHSETRWLDPHQQRQWRAIQRGIALLGDHLDRDLMAATGLSLNEYEVMVRLSEAPGRRQRMSVLAEGLVNSRSRLSHTVGRMEAKGLVSRCKADGDRRGVICSLTDEGYAHLEAAAPIHVASVRERLVDVISAEQLEVLGQSFAQIAAAIEGAAVVGVPGPDRGHDGS